MMRAIGFGAGRLCCGQCGTKLGFLRLAATAAAVDHAPGTVDLPSQPKKRAATAKKKPSKTVEAQISKKKWLDSMMLAVDGDGDVDVAECYAEALANSSLPVSNPGENALVLGIDPDFKGALAVLHCENGQFVPEIFDVPTLKVAIGRSMRLRPDARGIVNLLKKINAPQGSVAYLESSLPHNSDGKQSWWSSGLGFGMWTGTLLASGISVVPVPPRVWKSAMGISSNKEQSRLVASSWFPSMASQLTRKKDHGRAEALLIAAFGRGLTPQSEFSKVIREQHGETTR